MKTQFEQELDCLQQQGLKDNPLRLAYEQKVRELTALQQELTAQGKSMEEIARILHAKRRQLGKEYKEAAPPLFRQYIYAATAQKYGDPLGPDYDTLRKTKTPEQIIESAARPIADLSDRLTIAGFCQWYEKVGQADDQTNEVAAHLETKEK